MQSFVVFKKKEGENVHHRFTIEIQDALYHFMHPSLFLIMKISSENTKITEMKKESGVVLGFSTPAGLAAGFVYCVLNARNAGGHRMH